MAVFVPTNTFASGAVIIASGHNTNWSDVTTWLNNRYNGIDTWSFMKVSSTNANPVDITSSAAVTELSINNTATDGDPVITWELSGVQKFVLGVDDSDSDSLILSDASGFGATNIFKITGGAGGNFFVYNDFIRQAAGACSISVLNTSTTSGTATFISSVGGASAGDPFQTFTVTGATSWSIGIDNSDSDRFKISQSTALGTTDILQLTGSGGNLFFSCDLISTSDGVHNIGGATGYVNDINYKTLTDRGCLGWFDEGVELQDGRVVSDCDAILSIEKHPTKKTVYGIPMLDYRTFPKVSYKKADKGGDLLPRDQNDEPIGGQDGIEMTSMQSIMIGALKELHKRLAKIEDKVA